MQYNDDINNEDEDDDDDHVDSDMYIRVEVGGKVLLKCAVENLGER